MASRLPPTTPGRKLKRQAKYLPGIAREDSDDELGEEDHPWEWIYEETANEGADGGSARKRKRNQEPKIIGARMGTFQCRLGECVLLKAEGSNEAWVGIICDFIEEDGDDGEKAANFMWFSSEKEVRNSDKKRNDFEPVSCFHGHVMEDRLLTRLDRLSERALHNAIMGCQSIDFDQRKSPSDVPGCLPAEVPEWQDSPKFEGVWQGFYLSTRLQYENN